MSSLENANSKFFDEFEDDGTYSYVIKPETSFIIPLKACAFK